MWLAVAVPILASVPLLGRLGVDNADTAAGTAVLADRDLALAA